MTNATTFRSVSLPRSGNVLLLRYVHAYLALERGEAAYVEPDPKTLAGELPVLSARSHDFPLTDPLAVPDVLTVLQYREPRGHLLSYVDRAEALDPGRISGLKADAQWRWVARHAAYTIGFFEKWTQRPPEGAMVVPYEMLTAAPEETLTRLLSAIGRAPAPDMIAGAVALAGKKTVVNKQLTPYVARDLSRSAHLPGELVDAFDTLVRRQVGWIAWPPSGPEADPDAARRLTERIAQSQPARPAAR